MHHFWALALLVSTLSLVSALTTLTDETWLEAVANKSVFIMFEEPECEECEDMHDAWEKLSVDWEGHEIGLVARVDCGDTSSEILCEEYSIVSFPILLVGDPNSPEFYLNSDHSYEALSAYAEEHISHPPCNVENLQHCRKKEREILEDLMKKSREELEAMEDAVDQLVAEVENEYDTKIADIQAMYAEVLKEYNNKLDEVRLRTNFKWLQQVLRQTDEGEDYGGEL